MAVMEPLVLVEEVLADVEKTLADVDKTLEDDKTLGPVVQFDDTTNVNVEFVAES